MSQTRSLASDLPEDMLRAAMDWSLRLDDPSPDRTAFEAWLSEDPRHALAFERATDVLDPFDRPGAVMSWARDGALTRAQETRRRVSAQRTRAIAAGIAAALLLGAASYPLLDGVDVYRTGFGERRFVRLVDGSRLILDAKTTVKVQYSSGFRSLQLLQGQARFDVAHNAKRPFQVQAGARAVLATGTAFNVDLLGDELYVTLLEGHVKVAESEANTPFWRTPEPIINKLGVKLDPGQRLAALPGEEPDVTRATMDEINAWQEGKLLFRDVTLRDAVRRVNRYSERKIRLGDARVADLKISGVFPSDDGERFVEAVVRYLPASAERVGEGTTILHIRAY